MEQVFMDIACLSADVRQETSHMELCPDAMLSQVASMTPYSDYNQSPRNMYQVRVIDWSTDCLNNYSLLSSNDTYPNFNMLP